MKTLTNANGTRKIFTLNHAPRVFGELYYSHHVNGDALYLFVPTWADQCHMEQFVELKHVTEHQ